MKGNQLLTMFTLNCLSHKYDLSTHAMYSKCDAMAWW